MMKAVSGYSLKAVRNMITAIRDQTGTPQNPLTGRNLTCGSANA